MVKLTYQQEEVIDRILKIALNNREVVKRFADIYLKKLEKKDKTYIYISHKKGKSNPNDIFPFTNTGTLESMTPIKEIEYYFVDKRIFNNLLKKGILIEILDYYVLDTNFLNKYIENNTHKEYIELNQKYFRELL